MHTTLTDRQERFVLEYLKDQNASAAAARAGYTAKNMAAQGSELMAHPAVRERVRLAMQDLLAELRASALALMKQRVRAAFFDPAKLVRGWEPIPLEELDEETRAVLEVRTVIRKSGRVIHVKQPDRHRALRALEKAYEKLDVLNEKYWARLEREGGVMSLEEIEAMADEEEREREAENAKKSQVLSGGMDEVALAAARIAEKEEGLLGGDGEGREAGVLRGPEIRGQSTFAGEAFAKVIRPQFPALEVRGISEKPGGLSGWEERAGCVAAVG
ncbi:MAG TPA: terminase small subunit [Burkholderiales bacterium]